MFRNSKAARFESHEPLPDSEISVDDRQRDSKYNHATSFAASADALSEIAQARIRNWIHLSVIVLAVIALKFDAGIDPKKIIYTAIYGVSAGFGLYFWAVRLHERALSKINRLSQRAASMASDVFLISWVLYFGGSTFAGLYALYIWISVGYGIRYGLNYLFSSTALSVICFLVAAWYTPFWHSNPGLVCGMLFGLIIVPAYVGYLITQLQRAVAEKDLAYRAKSDFVAMMSHELRTPLHGIISTSDLLRGTASSPKQKEMIRIIATSSNTLLELINRVLDISKFESNAVALQKQPMDLHAVVNDTANILWPQALRKGLSLHVYIDPEIQNSLIGSPHQLQEVLINLLGNAVKFTDSGNVSARVLHRGETDEKVSVRFEISDTGPGIPKKALANIFDPFIQSDSPTTRKHGGTGLGTAFAKELIRLMSGTISVESTEGVGTKFTIDVDLQKIDDVSVVAKLYPFNVICLGFEDTGLPTVLHQFGTKSATFRSLSDMAAGTSHQSSDSSTPDAVFVNADLFADNLGGVVRAVNALMPVKITPVFACGSAEFKSSAIAAGYSAYIPRVDDKKLVGRSLNMISALRHEVVEESHESRRTTVKLRVLVADDNATNQRIAQMVLEEAGHKCTIVSNGDEALDALHEGEFDLAILDMHMPNRDGMEVAKIYNFSHFDPADRIPLIMMTADGRTEAREEAKANGIDAFVTKPITPARLISVIESVATSHEIEGEIAQVEDSFEVINLEQKNGSAAALVDRETMEELLSYMEAGEKKAFFDDFIADGSGYIHALLDCDDTVAARSVKEKMHAFAGACLVIGAGKLASRAREIEVLDDSLLLQDHTRLHDEVLTLFSDTIEVIRSDYLADHV